jgi:hypothetical protein
MLAAADDMAQRVRGFIRDIDGMVTAAVSRSHAAAGSCGCPPARLSSTIGSPGGQTSVVGLSYSASAAMAMAASPVPGAAVSGSGSSSLDLAASTLLPSCAQDVEKALDTLCNALEAVAADTQHKRQATEGTLQTWLDKVPPTYANLPRPHPCTPHLTQTHHLPVLTYITTRGGVRSATGARSGTPCGRNWLAWTPRCSARARTSPNATATRPR